MRVLVLLAVAVLALWFLWKVSWWENRQIRRQYEDYKARDPNECFRYRNGDPSQ